MSLILAFVISYALCLAVIYISRNLRIFLDDQQKPQRLHKDPTPRIGGLAIFVGSLFLMNHSLGSKMILAAVPAFLAGFFEDLIGGITPRVRLLFMIFSAVLGVHLFGALVDDLEFFKVPYVLTVPLTLLLVVGVTNSINIIDGLNGLASGFCLIAFSAFSLVAHWVGDKELAFVLPKLIFPILGFFVLNFPRAAIFLGDSGAYYLGFMAVEMGLLLIHRNPSVSKFFPLLVLFYPIWEVLFSIYRRRFYKKTEATAPDRLHLHTLLFKRTNLSNAAATSLILLFTGILSLFGVTLYNQSLPQMIAIVMLIALYHTSYRALISFDIHTKSEKVLSLAKFNRNAA